RNRTPSWGTVRSIIARQDTLRAEAINSAVRARVERIQNEHQERVERAVAARLDRAGGDVDRLRAEVDAYRQALGGRLDLNAEGRSRPYYTDSSHTRQDLKDTAELLRRHQTLLRAA